MVGPYGFLRPHLHKMTNAYGPHTGLSSMVLQKKKAFAGPFRSYDKYPYVACKQAVKPEPKSLLAGLSVCYSCVSVCYSCVSVCYSCVSVCYSCVSVCYSYVTIGWEGPLGFSGLKVNAQKKVIRRCDQNVL